MGDLQEYDEVVVSGYCLSEGRFFYRMPGVIATLRDRELKIWPQDGRGDSKLWFRLRTLRVHYHDRARYLIMRGLGGGEYFAKPHLDSKGRLSW